jgi:hypothetical protein
MIVKLQVLDDDISRRGGRTRDKVILAIDKALKEAVWEADGEDSWLIRQ